MTLSLGLCGSDALFQDILGLFNELSMKVDGIRRNSTLSVILAEDELRRLSIVLFHQLRVSLALLRVLMCCGAISTLVRLMRLLRSGSIRSGASSFISFLLANEYHQPGQSIVNACPPPAGPNLEVDHRRPRPHRFCYD